MVPPVTALPVPVNFSAERAAALNRGWFLTSDTAQTVAPEQDTLALAFQLAPGHYPLMARAIFALGNADFVQVRAANMRAATPANKPTIGVPGTSSVVGGTSSAGLGLIAPRQLTPMVGPTLLNLVPQQRVRPLFKQATLSQFHSPIPSISPPPPSSILQPFVCPLKPCNHRSGL